MAVFMCAVNYVKLFEVSSHHVRAYFWFIQLLMPHIVKLPDPGFHDMLETFKDATPAEFFNLVSSRPVEFGLKTNEEKAFDLQDVVDFYSTSSSKLRSDNELKKEG